MFCYVAQLGHESFGLIIIKTDGGDGGGDSSHLQEVRSRKVSGGEVRTSH